MFGKKEKTPSAPKTENTVNTAPAAENGAADAAAKVKHSSFRSVSPDAQNKAPFAVVEAYKNIRIHLVSYLNETNGKVVAFSSPNASEGKSTTAVNVAIILAQLNKKVILIDTDIRRATVHKKLKLENDVGCCDVLLGKANYKDAVKKYSTFLDVMTCGNAEENPSELFISAAYDELIENLKNDYDYIIIDTPPINLISDALAISQKSDGIVLIARSDVTTYAAFRSTLDTIGQLNIKVIGTIINGFGASKAKYHSYYKYNKYNYYRYGYK